MIRDLQRSPGLWEISWSQSIRACQPGRYQQIKRAQGWKNDHDNGTVFIVVTHKMELLALLLHRQVHLLQIDILEATSSVAKVKNPIIA